MLDDKTIDRCLAEALAAATEAGAAIRGFYKDSYTVKDKGQDNPLTDADLAADAIIERHLRDTHPDWGWLSEETGDDGTRVGKPVAWIIDPLDGTKEFTLGIPEFVVSIALVVDERPLIGVLYNPIQDQLFAGVVGRGATLNGAPIHVSDHRVLQGSRVVCSRTEMKKGWFDNYTEVEPMPVGSVAYKFGLVAAGMAEATFTPQPRNEWDIAGGVALVEAAGGRTSNRHRTPYRFNQQNPLVDGVMATNGHIHDAIAEMMAR